MPQLVRALSRYIELNRRGGEYLNFNLFVKAAKKIGLPSGNYMFLGGKTKKLTWFMVNEKDYENTVVMEFLPGASRYGEILQARELHRKCDKKNWHRKLTQAMKGLKK